MWGVDEWFFFSRDLAKNHLTEGGSAVKNKYDMYYDEKLRNFFVTHGAEVHKSKIHLQTCRLSSQ